MRGINDTSATVTPSWFQRLAPHQQDVVQWLAWYRPELIVEEWRQLAAEVARLTEGK